MIKKYQFSKYLKTGLFLLLITFSFMAAAHTKKANKTGILLVSFGSSYPETRATFQHIEAEVKATFPDLEIHWAFTSKIIRNKLRSRGETIDSPAEALAKMGEEGFTNVAVQSLHVIPGEEYENLKTTVEAFSGMPKGIDQVQLGKPLLYHQNDIENLGDVLLQNLPKGMVEGDVVVFMGHGTHHPANVYYPGMQYYLWQKHSNVFLATVEGYPELNQVIEKLETRKVNKVWLLPFMTIAGDHARNDMAGEEEESWKSVLEARGYKTEAVLRGMADQDNVVRIWIEHLKEVLIELKSK
ncbi:sirohydrochlorin cobaltochelatase [Labilibaculum sp. A4]|uniref:sirohydrochlorin cobaltochelatase n=1 Tax=Labilibaculum euxinus TaxID=2686357 RepID=UPI000F617C33|nr:sirohydrochlorin cobaltochelatase [Labilibaculum euxinus]MDQ1770207.1 sirohydrochlorin cobaltochelatase [Labilibaculum euxinus]MWN77579.1 sirohydrochlorin cobaltochelatase [Labilibaculum euxinus]